tara:strand:- start:68 stop:799 length:732 start_codon:yes stop_codon:yes gene_type:complete
VIRARGANRVPRPKHREASFLGFDLNKNTGPSASLVIEEKPICASAIAQCLRSSCDITDVRLEKSMDCEGPGRAEGRFRIVLVDLATINYDFEGLGAFVARHHSSPVVAIDDRPNPAFSRISAKLNCRGYIAKTFEEILVSRAINVVISGQSWFSGDADTNEDPAADCESGALSVLTRRQEAVLACIALGYSNEEIAGQLGISVGTVKTHVHAVLRRIGARNRTEAAIVAPRFGLLPRIPGPF